jgi:hypothetical protein
MQGEEEKMAREPALKRVGAACYPLSMSTSGRMSAKLHAMVGELARRLAQRRDSLEGQEKCWLYQRISLALQRANGQAFVRMGAAMLPERARQ